MKKKVAVVMLFALAILISFTVGAYAASNIKLIINGKSINTDIQVVNGSSYVPLRVVSENLGANVKWDNASRTITITSAAGDSSNGTPPPAASGSAKSFPVNVDVTSGPMKMHISNVTLDPGYKQYESFSKAIQVLTLDVTVENTSSDLVSWSPAYGVIVTDTKEQAQGYHYSDPVSGDFMGNVVKKGKLRFQILGELNSITRFTFKIDSPIGNDYAKVGEETTTEVIFR